MKILHTSEWHVGHRLCGFDRAVEHDSFFSQLSAIVEKERPEALIVCGDVYDSAKPSPMSRSQCRTFLVSMRQRYPDMAIIVDGDVEADIYDSEGIGTIYAVAKVAYTSEGMVDVDRHIVEVKNVVGEGVGYVVAMPHMAERELRGVQGRLSPFQQVLDAVEMRNREHLPVVLMACQRIEGVEDGGGDTIAQSVIGDGYDYLALGGVHTAQTLASSTPVACYAGSPLSLTFDEVGRHSVSVVTVRHHRPPEVVRRDIISKSPLLTLPAEPASFGEALEALEALDATSCYVRLNIKGGEPLPADSSEMVSRVIGDRKGICYCGSCRDVQRHDVAAPAGMAGKVDVMDVFERYYMKQNGCEPAQWIKDLMNEALSNVDE